MLTVTNKDGNVVFDSRRSIDSIDRKLKHHMIYDRLLIYIFSFRLSTESYHHLVYQSQVRTFQKSAILDAFSIVEERK